MSQKSKDRAILTVKNIVDEVVGKVNNRLDKYDKSKDKERDIYEMLCLMCYYNASTIPILIKMLVALEMPDELLDRVIEDEKSKDESIPSYIR